MFTPPSSTPQRPGRTAYTNAALASGNTDIVTGAANTTGLMVRTAFLGGGAGGSTTLWDGGAAYFVAAAAGVGSATIYNGPDILIPPGSPLRLTSNGGGGAAFVTYDVL